MKLLAIETSALVASCAILDEEKVIAEYTLNFKLTHSQTIMPMIDEIIKRTGFSPKELDYIACSRGPGSFTGLRIGAATAKGLAMGYGIPIIPVPTIKALAYNVSNTEKLICPIMDARREQVYTGVFRWNKENLTEVFEEEATTIDDIIEKVLSLKEEVIFLGDGVSVHKEKLNKYENFSFAPINNNHQRAASIGAIGLEMAKEGKAVHGREFYPVYLRKPQAERELEEKLNGEQP